MVFWHAVLQEPVMPLGCWKVEAQVYHTRETSPLEVSKLHTMMYLPSSTKNDLMVPLDSLVECLGELAMRMHRIEATLKSLENLKLNSLGDVLAQGSVVGGFVQPQTCPLTKAQAQQEFSLKAEFPEYFQDGTVFMDQTDACYKFFEDPPVGSGLAQSVGAHTVDIWFESAQKFLGYLRKWEGLEPSFVHLRNTTLLAKFFSFRVARENGWNTIQMEFQNLCNLFPFAFSSGSASGIPVVSGVERMATVEWMKEMLARARAEAKKPENRKRAEPTMHLSKVWETQEKEWTTMLGEFEVRNNINIVIIIFVIFVILILLS